MTDLLAPAVLDTIAAHLRRCAVLTDDAEAVDIIMTAARQLDDRGDELRNADGRRPTPPKKTPPHP